LEGKLIPLYSIDQIPGQLERRVFIGGNYDNCAVLREIASIVQDLGYQPIIALDFDIPETEIRRYDLILLHNCKYAIFEVTFSNGHLIEIERARDYDVQTLLVYQVRDENRKPPPGATQMILTSAFPRFGYKNFTELKEYLRSFLPPLIGTVSKTVEIKYNSLK
jgi:hypothetical protein